ncbi:hypothetical protein FACS1894196_4730 [Clostridia bacterium]|nr:hypothetical protein FACS1894196_4730 [Clostridia bacterium]
MRNAAGQEKVPVKVYVPVVVAFDEDGRMIPESLTWEDGQRYEIERLLAVRPGYAARVGGHGDRYTVRIGTQQRYLYFEHNLQYGQPITGRWFVERKA